MKLAVVLVHGIGNQESTWADSLIDWLKAQVMLEIAALAGPTTATSAAQVLVVDRVYWADVLQEPQLRLRRILETAHDALVLKGKWWAKALRAVYWALRRKERGWVTEFIGDIIGYRSDSAYKAVHSAMSDALDRLTKELGSGDEKVPLTVIAHSLGTVIAGDHFWDRLKKRKVQDQNGYHDRLAFFNFFTVGSPLALFSLQYGGPEAFRSPVKVEGAVGRWINLYDVDDPVAMPLKPLNDAYDRAVFRDVEVEAGQYIVSHTRYFSDERIMKIIARKLALDWLALNQKLPADERNNFYARYDASLKL